MNGLISNTLGPISNFASKIQNKLKTERFAASPGARPTFVKPLPPFVDIQPVPANYAKKLPPVPLPHPPPMDAYGKFYAYPPTTGQDFSAGTHTQENYNARDARDAVIDALGIFVFLVLLLLGLWITTVILLIQRWSIIPNWAKVVSFILLLPIAPIPPGSSIISLILILATTTRKVTKSAFAYY